MPTIVRCVYKASYNRGGQPSKVKGKIISKPGNWEVQKWIVWKMLANSDFNKPRIALDKETWELFQQNMSWPYFVFFRMSLMVLIVRISTDIMGWIRGEFINCIVLSGAYLTDKGWWNIPCHHSQFTEICREHISFVDQIQINCTGLGKLEDDFPPKKYHKHGFWAADATVITGP